MRQRPKIAIFDLTDCEGCEVVMISWLRKLLNYKSLRREFEIVNWRLTQEAEKNSSFDLAIIEGTPVSRKEQETLKLIRERSKYVIVLGACAATGGVNAIIEEKKRQKIKRDTYGLRYKPKAIEARPVSNYIKIDGVIPGCPATKQNIEEVLSSFLFDKPHKEKTYSVCFECKEKENNCLLLQGKPCLGPITRGGCLAPCPEYGLECYGCFGYLEGANIEAMKVTLEKILGKKKAADHLRTYLKNQIS
ncbi:MAG: hypothetical protein A2174_01125 [Candidatus Portnoybacteria bacterium RBG_13_41_18]|uniref:NADH:ubiquinone oxidoreductase-like 20kDa subunit domain-containing protein n=1 Tax=Candidatus Portnoybacteria bacterium RBG_13_41_18 TaxID=1801991 RepID=A0A1G2F4W5_9BACT|nr:MAG: hypothetical protein A2174_01125 [Candidatus Portnoybacteria bacterium RBG_13_41_18]